MSHENLPPLNWLRCFEAAELNITQSAVSQQIKLLESCLQETLFFREGRSLRLTEAGLNYIPFVQEAFELLRTGTCSVFGRDRGQSLTLRANLAFTFFWLTPRLSELYARYPWMNLDILTELWDTQIYSPRTGIDIRFGIKDVSLSEQTPATRCFIEWLDEHFA